MKTKLATIAIAAGSSAIYYTWRRTRRRSQGLAEAGSGGIARGGRIDPLGEHVLFQHTLPAGYDSGPGGGGGGGRPGDTSGSPDTGIGW